MRVCPSTPWQQFLDRICWNLHQVHPKSQESTVQKIGIDEFGVWKAWKSKEAYGNQLYTGHKKYPKSEAKSLLLGSHCNKDPVVTVTKCCVKPAKAHAVPSEHLCTRWDGPWLAAQSRTQKHLWYVNDKRAESMIRDIRHYKTISHGNSIFNQFPVRCGNISKHTGHDLAKNHSMLSSSSKCHLGWIRRTNSGLLRTQQSHGPWKSLAQPSSLPKKMLDDIYFLNDFGDGSFAPNFCKSRYRFGTNVLYVSI